MTSIGCRCPLQDVSMYLSRHNQRSCQRNFDVVDKRFCTKIFFETGGKRFSPLAVGLAAKGCSSSFL